MKNAAGHKKAVWSAYLILPIAGVCVDIYTPALPALVHSFSTAPQSGQWTITAYLVSYGIAQLLFGPLSDCHGRKRIMLGGIGVFLLATFGMCTASSLSAFMVLRLLQGIAVAAVAAPCRAILPDLLKGDALTKSAGTLALAFSLGPVLAPAIGGYAAQHFGWRAPLWVLWLYGCVILALLCVLPETHPIENRAPLTSQALRSCYRTILKSTPFRAFVLIITLMYSVPIMFHVVGPFLVQIVLRQSAVTYGSLGFLLGCAWLAGNLLNRATVRWNIRLKMGVLLSILSFLAALSSLWFYAMPLSLNGLRLSLTLLTLICGILFPAGFSFCLGLFPNAAGTASALIGAISITGTGLMSAAASRLDTSSAVPLMVAYFLIFMASVTVVSLAVPAQLN